MFTTWHYRVISLAIRKSSHGKDTISRRELVNLLSYHFKLDNPRFNEELFLIEAGVPAYVASPTSP